MLTNNHKFTQITTPYSGTTIDVSPDGKYIACGSEGDCSISIWDIKTGKQVGQSLEGHSGAFLKVKYSQDGERILSSCKDGIIIQWDTKTHTQIGKPLMGHKKRIDYVQYTLNQKNILSCSFDKTIRVWNSQTGKEIVQKRIQNTHPIFCMSVLKYLAYGDSKKMIYIWDYRNHKQIGTIRSKNNYILEINYSSDGTRLVSCGSESLIQIYDMISRTELHSIIAHPDHCVYSVNFFPDNGLIISGSDDKTARVWNSYTGILVCQREYESSLYATMFTKDGKQMITGSNDRNIIIMDCPYI